MSLCLPVALLVSPFVSRLEFRLGACPCTARSQKPSLASLTRVFEELGAWSAFQLPLLLLLSLLHKTAFPSQLLAAESLHALLLLLPSFWLVLGSPPKTAA